VRSTFVISSFIDLVGTGWEKLSPGGMAFNILFLELICLKEIGKILVGM